MIHFIIRLVKNTGVLLLEVPQFVSVWVCVWVSIELVEKRRRRKKKKKKPDTEVKLSRKANGY